LEAGNISAQSLKQLKRDGLIAILLKNIAWT
jgi:hypothetical protein